MALRKAKIVTITSVKGGTGKTLTTLNLAGVFAKMDKKVLIIDLDLYAGAIGISLNMDPEKNVYNFVNDFENNRFSSFENYTAKITPEIDAIGSPRDPRVSNKLNTKYLHALISKASMKYDVVLIDTNHIIDELKLVVMDESDEVVYVISNDPVDLKNMKSMVSIYKDMERSNYLILLNEAKDKDGNFFNKTEIKNIIKKSVDYTIPANFYIKDLDKYVLEGKILTLESYILNTKKSAIKNFKLICKAILRDDDSKKTQSKKIDIIAQKEEK